MMRPACQAHDRDMTTTAAPNSFDRITSALRRSPITRSDNKILAGVCAGIAESLGVSTTIVRVATFVLGIISPIVGLYLLAWLLLPNRRGEVHLDMAIRGGKGSSIVLLVITALTLIPDSWAHGDIFGFWTIALLVVLAIVIGKQGKLSRTTGQLPQAQLQQPAPWTQPSPAHTDSQLQWPPAPTGTPTYPGPQDSPRA